MTILLECDRMQLSAEQTSKRQDFGAGWKAVYDQYLPLVERVGKPGRIRGFAVGDAG
jgi:hypothetical protein